jgi:Ca-activated chloride channel homolog
MIDMKEALGTFFTGFALLTSGPLAQVPEAGKPQVISVDVTSVNVLFRVTDKKGKSVRNLTQDHFRVYEDNRRQTITNFSSEGNLPLTVALLIDTSGSVRDKLRFEQEAAGRFFQSTLVPDRDRAVAMSFDTNVTLIQDYTGDPGVLSRAIRRMSAGGGTALFDAIYLAVTKKLTGQDGRRILVVITDGDDTASRLSLNDALDAAQRNDVILYAISTNSPGLGGAKNRGGDEALKKLCEATGGKVFFPARIEDLSSNFRDITEELRFQYALAYSPINLVRDGGFRRIRVEPSDKRYMVRARTGYFAPLPGADTAGR